MCIRDSSTVWCAKIIGFSIDPDDTADHFPRRRTEILFLPVFYPADLRCSLFIQVIPCLLYTSTITNRKKSVKMMRLTGRAFPNWKLWFSGSLFFLMIRFFCIHTPDMLFIRTSRQKEIHCTKCCHHRMIHVIVAMLSIPSDTDVYKRQMIDR